MVELIFYIMEILNNPWITGIVGGVISGFIVYFVTSKLLSKKQNKEYSQKVTTANNEILYVMRPLIVQKQIPSKLIIESTIESIARKYEVNKSDLFDIPLLADDLIREVMENAFLDSKQKMEFCTKINELKVEKITSKEIVRVYEKIVYRKDRISSQYVSILLAATASTMVLFISFFSTIKGGMNFNGFNNFLEASTITLISVIVPMVAMTMTMFLKKIRQYESDKKNEHEEEKKKKKTPSQNNVE
ncbi:MAG: hypothetical protein ABFQ62_00615 [Patescibacteria group bacterium]